MHKLAEHPVLSMHWHKLSLVLKGSTARGNADTYSDIDFVFFCYEKTYRKVITDYRKLGLSQREDGFFAPLDDTWIGHYTFETLEKLAHYFGKAEYPQVWEYQNAIALHDSSCQFASLIASLSADFLSDPLPAIREEYMNLQLTLDWMRHPLRRGDQPGAVLHCARLLQGFGRISYLLDGVCYPHDKWLFPSIGTTRFGRANKRSLHEYAAGVAVINPKHLELDDYPQFTTGAALVIKVMNFIKRYYGDHQWIDEWYLFV